MPGTAALALARRALTTRQQRVSREEARITAS
jgi:hypothetical protein